MAPVRAILRALRKVARRNVQTFFSVVMNNFFLFGALLAYSALASALPVFAFIGILILFPLTSDPLSKVPRSRLAMWPLTKNQRLALRISSLALSPVVWLPLLVLIATRQVALSLAFLVVVFGIQILSVLGIRLWKRVPTSNPLSYLPQPPSHIGGLIRHNVRQVFSVLDFYLALMLCVGAVATRGLVHSYRSAAPFEAVLIGFALSTYAQCSFGLDSASALTRYHTLPLRGRHVLLAKDAAFMILLLILVAPLSLQAGLTFGLLAIAFGRYPSLALRLPQHRWRFTGGDIRFCVLQSVLGLGLAIEEIRRGPWFLVIAVGLYAISLYAGGWYWDQKMSLRKA